MCFVLSGLWHEEHQHGRNPQTPAQVWEGTKVTGAMPAGPDSLNPTSHRGTPLGAWRTSPARGPPQPCWTRASRGPGLCVYTLTSRFEAWPLTRPALAVEASFRPPSHSGLSKRAAPVIPQLKPRPKWFPRCFAQGTLRSRDLLQETEAWSPSSVWPRAPATLGVPRGGQ